MNTEQGIYRVFFTAYFDIDAVNQEDAEKSMQYSLEHKQIIANGMADTVLKTGKVTHSVLLLAKNLVEGRDGMSTPGERLAVEQRYVAEQGGSRWHVWDNSVSHHVAQCETEADADHIAAALNREALTEALVEALRAASERAHVSRMHGDPYSYCNAATCIADRALIARYEAARGGAWGGVSDA